MRRSRDFAACHWSPTVATACVHQQPGRAGCRRRRIPTAATSTDPATALPVAADRRRNTCRSAAEPAGARRRRWRTSAAIVGDVAHPVRADRRRHRRGRDAAHRATRQRASERGIGIAGSADPAATHVLKGYFSAMTEGRSTTVIYVWDVLRSQPATGCTASRASSKAHQGSGDGWAGVPPATMQAIADRTIDQLAAWLAGTHGLMRLCRA